MTVVDLLTELGGVARRSALLKVVDRSALDRALDSGAVVRTSRGVYALADVDESVRAAAVLGGVLSLTSAALAHGWAVKTVPDRPHVIVSRGRRVDPGQQIAHIHRGELRPDQVDDGRTSLETTLEQCLRALPYDEALAIADSARRSGVGRGVFDDLADRVRGPGAVQVRRVCRNATDLAANPFESVLRAIAEDVDGLDLRPQVLINDGPFAVHPDLVDEKLRVVVEADSFEWHGKRSALASDCRRYNMLVIHGWLVLRFCYEDVMFHQDDVRHVLASVVPLAELLTQRSRRATVAA